MSGAYMAYGPLIGALLDFSAWLKDVYVNPFSVDIFKTGFAEGLILRLDI